METVKSTKKIRRRSDELMIRDKLMVVIIPAAFEFFAYVIVNKYPAK